MLKRTLSFGGAFVLFMMLLLGITASAFAAGGGVIGGDLSDDGDTEYSTSPTPGTGCAVSCPKVDAPPVAPPYGYYFRYSTSPYGVNTGGGGQTCATKADGRKPITITYRSVGVYSNVPDEERATNTGSGLFRATYWCNYQPESVVSSRSLTCPTSADGVVTGPSGYAGANTRNLLSFDSPSPWVLAGRPTSGCPGAWNVSVAQSINEDGYFNLDMNYYTTSCTVRTYGGTQPDEMGSCGTPRRQNLNKWMTISCQLPGGVADGRVAVGFGNDACRNVPQYWSCDTANVTFDGQPVTNRATTLADGIKRSADWEPLSVSNVSGINSIGARFSADSSGTPWRSDVSANSDLQPMQILPMGPNRSGTLGLNTTLSGDADLMVGYQQASMPDRPSVLNRTVTFRGMFPVAAASIDSIDLRTGQIDTTLNIIRKEGTGSCPSQPLVVSADRGRNVN